MNLFMVFIVGVCMAVSYYDRADGSLIDTRQAQHQFPIIMAWILCAPVWAYFQTRWVCATPRWAESNYEARISVVRRLEACHMVVWAASCLLIYGATEWSNIVRQCWQLKSVPVVFEFVLCGPIVIALTLSWAAFSGLQGTVDQQAWHHRLRQRWAYVMVRLRLVCLLLFLPLLLLLLAVRAANIVDHLALLPNVLLGVSGCTIAMLVPPWLMTKIWPIEPLDDGGLADNLQRCCADVGVRLDRIWRWKTGPEIVNAAVVRTVPWRTTILLTDGLLRRFEPEEIEAIVRHEAGHVQCKHLLWKMLFIVLPLSVMVIDSTSADGVASWTQATLSALNLVWAAQHSAYLVAIAFGLYLAVVLRWLSHQMEFEADLFSATKNGIAAPNLVEHTRAALWRLSMATPQQFRKNTFLHPSLKSRILRIEDLAGENLFTKRHQRRFRLQKAVVVIVWCVLLVIVLR